MNEQKTASFPKPVSMIHHSREDICQSASQLKHDDHDGDSNPHHAAVDILNDTYEANIDLGLDSP